MPARPPKFWYRDNLSSSAPIIEKILSPVSKIYQCVHRLNMHSGKTRKVSIPVICVGNVTVGGSGKTPVVIALKTLITKHNLFKNPYFLSRGYGGSQTTTARCITGHEDARDTGDEPLLLAYHSKTITSVNRHEGAKLAQSLGADCIIMDDGLQNFDLFKDISFLVIDGKAGFGNQKTLPAGPLREPVKTALKRANAAIIIGKDHNNVQAIIANQCPTFSAHIEPSNLNDIDLSQSYIGFAGLGHPKKFHETLQKYNINTLNFHEFPDHHPYSQKEITRLLEEAKRKNATPITTEKDYQRIPEQYRKSIKYLAIKLVWDNEENILNFLKHAIPSPKDN